MKEKVVVIGHGYTSRLGVIRALGREGYEVTVIVLTGYNRSGRTLKTTKPIDCYSKYVNQIFYCPSDRDALIELLLDKCVDPTRKTVLFADSDFSEAAVDLNQDRLRDYFLFSHVNHKTGLVVAWMDKMRQKSLAKECGLNVANGWVVKVKKRKYEIPAEIRYPCFPKPLSTIVGGKGGLRRCDNEEQLREVVELLTLKNPDIDILVEEFIQIETEFALLGFSDGVNVIVPGVIKTLSLANGNHFGVAKQGRILPTGGYQDLVDQFKIFVQRIGFTGIFDIDFYSSYNKFFFCEINFRYGGSGYAYTAMGVNLPDMMARYLLGHSIKDMTKEITEEAVFVNERMCREDWNNNYISSKQFRQLISTADISFLYAEEDPEPLRMYYKDINSPIRTVKRMIKRFLAGTKWGI